MGRFTDQYWGLMWNSSTLCPLAVCGSSWWSLSINSFQSFTLNHPSCMLYLIISPIDSWSKDSDIVLKTLTFPFYLNKFQEEPITEPPAPPFLTRSASSYKEPRSQGSRISKFPMQSRGTSGWAMMMWRVWRPRYVWVLGEQEALGQLSPSKRLWNSRTLWCLGNRVCDQTPQYSVWKERSLCGAKLVMILSHTCEHL